MKPNASKSWRAEGDDDAFDDTAWEFKAEQFLHSAKRLLELIEEAEKKPSIDLLTLPFTAEFLISLAMELIAKAELDPKVRPVIG